MDAQIITHILTASIFLLIAIGVRLLARRMRFFPSAIVFLILGFVAQYVVYLFPLSAQHTLTSVVAFSVLLPLVLFESSMHLNLNRFKPLFKAITFYGGCGLMVSALVIGFLLMYLLHVPFGVVLLFGVVISVIDSATLLSIFNTVKTPKKLVLFADGEKIISSIVGIILFQIVTAFVLVERSISVESILGGLGSFIYVLFGSVFLGGILGYGLAYFLERVKDQISSVIGTVFLTLLAFIGAEYFMGLSGIILVTTMGIVFGNSGRVQSSNPVTPFIHESWEYIRFLVLSLVMFFVAFNLNIPFSVQNIGMILVAIGVVLIARSISVYVSAFFTNKLAVLHMTSPISMNWQHILNWGGIRGFISILLVYSLPDSFEYKQMIFQFTVATVFFTLAVNRLTVEKLLFSLNPRTSRIRKKQARPAKKVRSRKRISTR